MNMDILVAYGSRPRPDSEPPRAWWQSLCRKKCRSKVCVTSISSSDEIARERWNKVSTLRYLLTGIQQ